MCSALPIRHQNSGSSTLWPLTSPSGDAGRRPLPAPGLERWQADFDGSKAPVVAAPSDHSHLGLEQQHLDILKSQLGAGNTLLPGACPRQAQAEPMPAHGAGRPGASPEPPLAPLDHLYSGSPRGACPPLPHLPQPATLWDLPHRSHSHL